MRASTDVEIDAAFEAVAQQRISALTVIGDPFFATQREKFAALAARYAVPAMYHFRHYVVAGA
jgi:putative ABC transport system substrate-binding protein